MIRTLLLLVVGIGLGAGAMNAAHHHEDGEKVKVLSATDIKEIILQQMIYCGVPAANHAFREAGEIVKELGKA